MAILALWRSGPSLDADYVQASQNPCLKSLLIALNCYGNNSVQMSFIPAAYTVFSMAALLASAGQKASFRPMTAAEASFDYDVHDVQQVHFPRP